MSLLSTTIEQGLILDILDDTNPDDMYLGYYNFNSSIYPNCCMIKRIQKQTVGADKITTIKFPHGKQDFSFSWDLRKTYPYRHKNFNA